ncbi:hypothetical protein HPB49_021398 [Dermacentor silvarum]|uniref:Uncharacterized protein n=1 Tax=Dermacentor silvarum TaxID=543639 RepID=A0ACB8CB81_DERSI|nr:hypothetical protein HPB49_021398 [Dermacentor silvarum]
MHGPIDARVTKATIALGSIFENTCTSNAQREPRGASCSEGRYLYKLSEPPCDYSEQCAFAQLNGVCTDNLIGDCALDFVRSLDGKTCDKLQTTAGNKLESPARPTVNATQLEPLASRTSVRAPATVPLQLVGFRALAVVVRHHRVSENSRSIASLPGRDGSGSQNTVTRLSSRLRGRQRAVPLAAISRGIPTLAGALWVRARETGPDETISRRCKVRMCSSPPAAASLSAAGRRLLRLVGIPAVAGTRILQPS